MLNNKKTLIALFVLVLVLTQIQAQVATTASGGNGTGSGGSVSYSVGQVVYTTATGGGGSSAIQGVQQPYVITVITGINDAGNITLDFVVYPNPVTDYLVLKITGDISGDVSGDMAMNIPGETRCIASLHNINGNMLQNRKMETNETTFSMQSYPSGTYFVRVAVEKTQRVIKTFKIIKN